MANRLLLALILFLDFSGIVFSADNLDFEKIKKSAEQGDATAEYSLGCMYYSGEGLPQNYTEAFKWYKKAAEKGHADAQRKLGFMYQKGQGVSQNHSEAIKWYRKAAEQGDAIAQYVLDCLFHSGEGVPKKYPGGSENCHSHSISHRFE